MGRVLTIVVLGAVATACAAPAPTAYDLRPAYEAARPAALAARLDCDGVNDAVCDCRRGGLAQEFAEPSRARFDAGYKALAAYRDHPAHEGHSLAQAEAYAVGVIFTAITADVEDICSYHEEGATS